MSDYKIIKPDAYSAMPWRNGLGVTVELLRQDIKNDAGFDWRISMADVTEDGEFSNFSGYDRTLVLLEGNGITLTCNGKKHRLSQSLQYAEFRGDDPTYATLHHGPVKDFNIMTHRDYCRAEVYCSDSSNRQNIKVNSNKLLIYSVADDLHINASHPATLVIPENHLLAIDEPDNQNIECEGSAFISIQITYF